MMLSLLPMNMFAAMPRGSMTGWLVEQAQGPATNVRHWTDNNAAGTLVGTDTAVAAHPGPEDASKHYVVADGSNLRHIWVGYDYFAGKTDTSISFRVQLHNAAAWVVDPDFSITDVFASSGAGGLGAQVVSTGSFSQLAGGLSLENQLKNNITSTILASAGTSEGALDPSEPADSAVLAAAQTQAANLAANIVTTMTANNIVGFAKESPVGALTQANYGLATRNRITYMAVVPFNPVLAVMFVPRSDTLADVYLVRDSGVATMPLGVSEFGIRVPIGFRTNGDSNDGVFITFATQSGWPAAGESMGSDRVMRTNLTTTLPAGRFSIVRDGDPKAFQRYGRVSVPNFRIREAVQGAFDDPAYIVDLEITTPGFFWTSDAESTGSDGLQLTSRFADNTTETEANRHIGPVSRLGAVRRLDNTRTSPNAILRVGVSLPGQSNPNRLINDWFQIGNLSIGANDRAREGDVRVDVVLRRAGQDTGTTSTTANSWSFSPAIAGQAPLTNPVGSSSTASVTEYRGSWVTTHAWTYAPLGSESPTLTTPTHRDANGATLSDPAGGTWTIAWSWVWTPNYTNPIAASPIGSTPTTWTSAQQTAYQAGQSVSMPDTAHGVWTYSYGWTTSTGTGAWGPVGDELQRTSLVVATYGRIGLEIFRHENDDLDDFLLRSGQMEWNQATANPNIITGAVSDIHGTARVVLREVVPGSLPATGAHPTTYTFPEGIQVLGATFWTNDKVLIAEQRDKKDQDVWYSTQREADNFLNTTISRNTVVIRPEIGREEARRAEMAQITAKFYISVQPGYEQLYGQDVEVVVTSGTVDSPIEERVTVAQVWDPIYVDTNEVVLDSENLETAFGLVRGAPINDITVTEVEAGTFFPGTRVWLGVEGGISRGWGAADQISLGATGAHVEGDAQMQITSPRLDSQGVYVEITRASREDGARIVFTGVEISGRVVPSNSYSIIVAGDAVSANWNGLAWVNGSQSANMTASTANYGFFTQEPYPTPAFSFEGAELYAPGTAITPPGDGSGSGGGGFNVGTGAVVLAEGMNYPTKTGEVLLAPVFRFVPNAQNRDFVTSYVMVRVVADVIGLDFAWNEATRTATFTGRGTTVSFTNGSSFAVVNGQNVAITATGLPADARIIDGRFFVPIKFFEEIFPGVRVEWNGTTRTVTVTP